jgi:hypothetical protein
VIFILARIEPEMPRDLKIISIIVLVISLLCIIGEAYSRISKAIMERKNMEEKSRRVLDQIANGKSTNVNGLAPRIRLSLMKTYLLQMRQFKMAEEVEKHEKYLNSPWYRRHVGLITINMVILVIYGGFVIYAAPTWSAVIFWLAVLLLFMFIMFLNEGAHHADNDLYERYQRWIPMDDSESIMIAARHLSNQKNISSNLEGIQ